MFDHPMESDAKRITEISEEIKFRKKNGLASEEL